MSAARDILTRHGFTPREPWNDGLISVHEIMDEVHVQISEARKIFSQLMESGGFDLVSTVHPKTHRTLTALKEKPAKRPAPKK